MQTDGSKLASILIRWKTNTAQTTPRSEQSNEVRDDSDCVEIFSSPDNEKKFTSKKRIDDSQESKPSSNQAKYQSLMSVLSRMGKNELISGLCNYIKSIDCAETSQKVWVQTSKPYSIRLTLQKLQGILKEGEPMDHDCFNIIKIIDFGRHPDYPKKLNVEQLVDSVCNGHGIDYNISKCKLILIPTDYCGTFVLIILDQETRTLYILDPTPLNPIYENNPNARYTKKLLCIGEYLAKAMVKACPRSRWNEDINLWRQIILPNVPIRNRELSGYYVSLFMQTYYCQIFRMATNYGSIFWHSYWRSKTTNVKAICLMVYETC
uniref:Ubiquitin-like protease family profile domain-containing protein n=1 Tax=Oryza glumipatula TaxID=40148 RepID=A0A0E0A840_9ORYZ